MTPRHSRTSRVPGLKEIGGAGVTGPAQRNGAGLLQLRAVALERPPYTRS